MNLISKYQHRCGLVRRDFMQHPYKLRPFCYFCYCYSLR